MLLKRTIAMILAVLMLTGIAVTVASAEDAASPKTTYN